MAARGTCASGISLNTDLNSAASSLLTASLAPATRTAYRKTWDLLIQSVPHAALPLSNIDLANFIGILFSQNYSPSSIASHVSAISYVHKIMDLPDPGHCFLVRKLLKGCQNISRQCDSRLPITPDILKKILLALNHTVSSSNLRTLLKSFFLLAFNAFLRLGEIAVRDPQYTNLVVQRSDVTLQSSGVQIVLRHYKNNKDQTPIVLFLKAQTSSKFCPVLHLTQYLAQFRHSSGPLFQFTNGKPVSSSFVSEQLRSAICFIGLNPKYYKGHSFRIGAATHASNLGYSENAIQKMGRWNSSAIRRYIRFDTFKI